MNIAVFGGAFNPPHWGHLAIAKQALDFCAIDQVWLMPTYRYDPVFKKDLASFSHRFAMTQFLEQPKIKVSDFEKNIAGTSHTYAVIKALQAKYPAQNFSFLMGSDNLTSFSRWYNYSQLLKICQILVFPREENITPNLHKGMTKISSPLLKITPISSTLVRSYLVQKKNLKGLLPEKVVYYIKQYKLYQFA